MSLKKLAAAMHQEARKYSRSNRLFNDGLQMRLLYRKEDVVLKLRKREAKPSEEEVKFCSSVFFFFGAEIENQVNCDKVVWLGVSKKSLFGVNHPS